MRTLTIFLPCILLLTIVSTYAAPSMAQVSERMLPYSVHTEANTVLVTYTVPPASLPLPPPEVLDGETGMPLVRPYQHGVETPVDLGFENAGRWRLLPDGGRLWQLRIVSEGARSLNLVYDDFWMPRGARLFLYNEDRSVVLGAFTQHNNKPHGGFATDLVPGEVTVLEYYEPAGVAALARLHISTVVQGRPGVEAPHKGALMGSDEPYVPLALPCSINTRCREGRPWAYEAQAALRIVQGGFSCTGVLLNNTRRDRTPYVLSVNHCGGPAEGDTLDWVFQFNYRSAGCADPSQTPTPQSVSGAVVRAAQGNAADFALLELLEPIPKSYRVEYAGWSINDKVSKPGQVFSSYGVVIGHPRGDIMKITFEDDPIIDLPMLPFYWVATFDRGSIEVGSSGSPLFNDRRQVIGLVRGAYQLDPNACSGPGGDDNRAIIAFPKLSYIWDLGVGAFLDPKGGTTSLGPLRGGRRLGGRATDGLFTHHPREENSNPVAGVYRLSGAYPNPFNPETTFSLSVVRTQQVEVSVYNLLGQRVALLHEGLLEAGTTSFRFQGALLPNGLYVIRVQGEHFVTSQTVTLLK